MKHENQEECGAFGERLRCSLWPHLEHAVPCLVSVKWGEEERCGSDPLRAFSPRREKISAHLGQVEDDLGPSHILKNQTMERWGESGRKTHHPLL